MCTELPWQVFVSGTWMYQAGGPETTTVVVRNDTISLPQGSQTVVVREVGSVRLPTQTTMDLNLRKDIRLGSGQRLVPRLEIFNVFNNSSIQSWITMLSGSFTATIDVEPSRSAASRRRSPSPATRRSSTCRARCARTS